MGKSGGRIMKCVRKKVWTSNYTGNIIEEKVPYDAYVMLCLRMDVFISQIKDKIRSTLRLGT